MSSAQRSIDQAAVATPQARGRRRSEAEFLRFCAGARALLALLGSILLFGHWNGQSPMLGAVVLSYLLFAALLLDKLLADRPAAASRRWLWVDAAFLAASAGLMSEHAPWLGLVSVAPVVAMSLLAGPLPATVMSAALALPLLAASGWSAGGGSFLPALPMLLLAFAPAANVLSGSGRGLRTRLQLLDELHRRSDPRQGLMHQVDVLATLLQAQYGLSTCVIGLQGPDPRVFERLGAGPTTLLDGEQAEQWRDGRNLLPSDAGCIGSVRGGMRSVRLIGLDGRARSDAALISACGRVLARIGQESLTLPLMSYGQPLGHLFLGREGRPFDSADLQCLNEFMREALPLLERSDLLEQLQRETAARERERIGRDLHDSAVQPYLGLKYGLEALAREAGSTSPLAAHLRQLVELTTQELAGLRDVVSGLRNRCDPLAETGFAAALRRQAERFQALYGLNVAIECDPALVLRGSMAKAMLHMVNEALTNVRRHTSATSVALDLDVCDGDLRLRVRNDLGATDTQGAHAPPFVPRSLTERARELGGGLQVQCGRAATEITITLPLLGAMA